MMRSLLSSTLGFVLLTGLAQSSPLAQRHSATAPAPEISQEWAHGAVTAFPIHESCNATLHRQLEQALGETVTLAQHAKDHLLRWGGESPIVQRYFGNGSTAGPIGWFERVVAADKATILFRCDDPDGNCATQDGEFSSSSPLPLIPEQRPPYS